MLLLYMMVCSEPAMLWPTTDLLKGTINSLKSHKKDVAEMRKGTECGMGFNDWAATEPGDMIQCYEEISEPRRLT